MRYLQYTGNNDTGLVRGFIYEQVKNEDLTNSIELLGIKGKFNSDLFEEVEPQNAKGEKPPKIGERFQYKLQNSNAKCVSQAKKITQIDDLTFIVVTSKSVLKLKCTRKASSR